MALRFWYQTITTNTSGLERSETAKLYRKSRN